MASATSQSDLVREYNEQGYTIVRGVLDAELIQEASRHVEWLQQQHPGVSPELLEHWYMRDDPFWLHLISDPRLLDVVQQFLGPNLASFASHYVCKPPLVGNRIHWHQDGSYWPLDPMQVASVWLAVDQSKKENGCMQVVPGSHKQGLKTMGLTPEEFNRHVTQVHMGAASDHFHPRDEEVVDIELLPGDISIHHPFLVHGSQANTSATRRCGLTIRYIPTSTRVVLDADNDADKHSKGSVFLLRGSAAPAVPNPYRTAPAFDPAKHFHFKGSQ